MTAWRTISPTRPGSGIRRPAVLILAAAFLLAILPAGCKQPPPEEILFRYQFHPGETLVYRVSLEGGGEVTMTMKEGGEGEDKISLPVRVEGSYLMEVGVEEVTPEGEAVLSLSYRDFQLTSVSRVREREMTALLTDRGLTISEGDRVIKEAESGGEGYPLRGIAGEKFEFRVDNRGTILESRTPTAPDRLFPSLQFDAFLERMQPEFPREPVPAGTSWTRTVAVPGPGLGRHWDQGERWSVEIDSTFPGFADRGNRVARIVYAGDYRQESPGSGSGDRSGLRGSFHRLEGSYEFDLAAGRVLAGRSTLRQTLDLKIAAEQVLRGREIDIRVDDTMEVTVELQ